MLENAIIIVAVAAIICGVVFYIYKAKKQGNKCIGCPHSGSCPSKSCGCNNK